MRLIGIGNDSHPRLGNLMYPSAQTLPFLTQNLQFRVLQLVSWPAVPQMAHDSAPDVARICALLARKPSTGMLIPALLGLPHDVAYALLDQLYAQGHIRAAAAAPTETSSLRRRRAAPRSGGASTQRAPLANWTNFWGVTANRLSVAA